MEHKMRRFRQLLSDEETKRIFENGTAGTLALLSDDGYTYSVPVSYAFIDNQIIMHSTPTGHKMESIRYHDKVSFCVINQNEVKAEELTSYFRSAIAFGKIRIIEDKPNKIKYAKLLGERFLPNNLPRIDEEIEVTINNFVMLVMDVEHMTGKEAIELVRMKEI